MSLDAVREKMWRPNSNSNRAKWPRHDAFTLLELLSAIAVIGILAAILLPVFQSSRKRALLATDLNHLRQLGQAAAIYETEHGRHPYGIAPLINASASPLPIVRSPLDPFSQGRLIAIRQKDRQFGLPDYSNNVIRSAPSYIGLAETHSEPNPALFQRITDLPGGGWLVNLYENRERPALIITRGKRSYQRLRMDSSVSTHRIFESNDGFWHVQQLWFDANPTTDIPKVTGTGP